MIWVLTSTAFVQLGEPHTYVNWVLRSHAPLGHSHGCHSTWCSHWFWSTELPRFWSDILMLFAGTRQLSTSAEMFNLQAKSFATAVRLAKSAHSMSTWQRRSESYNHRRRDPAINPAMIDVTPHRSPCCRYLCGAFMNFSTVLYYDLQWSVGCLLA